MMCTPSRACEIHRRIALSDPGIDDSRNELLWSPARPQLIDAEVTLEGGGGAIIDRVRSYTALRAVAVDGNRFVLNGRPYPLRLVLDQGYWPESGITAPDDAALKRDVELAKAMGFNGVRKHQKIEDPRYLYWADRLGLLGLGRDAERLSFHERIHPTHDPRMDGCDPARLTATLRHRLGAVQRVVGCPEPAQQPRGAALRAGLYHLTKTLDPTRPVIGNDGWESVATDIIGIHDYDADPERLGAPLPCRGSAAATVPARAARRSHARARRQAAHDQPMVLTEFGGIACSNAAGDLGLSRAPTARAQLAAALPALLQAVH